MNRRLSLLAGLVLLGAALALGARGMLGRGSAPRSGIDNGSVAERTDGRGAPIGTAAEQAGAGAAAHGGAGATQPSIPPASEASPEAIAEAERAVVRSPGDVTPLLRLGGLLYRARRFPEAIAAYDKVLAIDPGSAQAYLGIGLSRGKSDEGEAAAAAFRRAIEIDPNMAAAHNGLGVVLLRRGDRAAARLEFERALALDPELAVARTNLDTANAAPDETNP